MAEEKDETIMCETPCFEQVVDDYFAEQRTIWLIDEVTRETIDFCLKKLVYFAKQSKDPIRIYINSPGGFCDVGQAIVDTMEKIKNMGIIIETIGVGLCASMASTILFSGTKGHRYINTSGQVMVHQALSVYDNQTLNSTEMERERKQLQYWEDLNIKRMIKATGHKKKELEELVSIDRYLSPSEAKKWNLVDHIGEVI